MTNKDQLFEQEVEKLIKRVEEANTDNFFELAKILGKNLKKDLAGANLHECDLSNGDLQGANLRKTNLNSANLKNTNLRGADLSYSDISDANFTGSDLTNTIFDQVRAENAIFEDNLGIDERRKQDLVQKGAIFRDKLSSESSNVVRAYKRSPVGYLKYLLFDEVEIIPFDNQVLEIAAIEPVVDNEMAESNKQSQEKSLLNSILKLVSWTLVITFAVIFLYIIYQAFILNSEQANIIIYHAFTLILGCFIGGLTTYLKMASEQKYR